MNKRESLIKLVIALGLFILTFFAFFLLQNRVIYKYSLGVVSSNYEHLSNGDIVQKKIPYTQLSNTNFLHWDASHYKNIKDNAYMVNEKFGEACYAFFPLFPWVWKWTNLSPIGISILNYLLFAFSLVILSHIFLDKSLSLKQRFMVYTLALLLPGTVAFNIPYTESIFLFTFSLACFFYQRKNFLLFALFFILFAFTRPAITIILASLICTEIYLAFTGRTYHTKPGKIALRMIPVLIGSFLAMYIQYLYSGHWFKVFEVQQNWGYQHFKIPTSFSDWSEEGYGMSVFSLIAVFLPALFFLMRSFLKGFSLKKKKLPVNEEFAFKEYFFSLSLFYLVGMTLFTLFFRGGYLNGLQRYVMATPFFYVLFFYLADKLGDLSKKNRLIILLPTVLGGTIFFLINGYSRHFSFPDWGYYLFPLSLWYMMVFNSIPQKKQIIYALLLGCFLIVWKTYLLNMFLSDGWIFT